MDDLLGLEVDRDGGKTAILLWWGHSDDPKIMTFYFTNRAQWRDMSTIARCIARYGFCRVRFGDSSQLIVPNDGSEISINT